jgi:cytochrome c oxidase subunit 2
MRLPSLLKKALSPARLALALGGILLHPDCRASFWSDIWSLDGHQSTIHVEGPVAQAQLNLFFVTCWVTFIIFVIVASILAYATIKFKARTEADEHAEPPPQGHGNPMVEVGLIGGTVFCLVIIAVPTLRNIWYTYDVPAEEKANAYEVTATGYQWWFKFDYPSEQIVGAGNLTTGNELVIPAGRPVHVNLRSNDVMHSFWVPKLAGKVDMIPNRGNFLWLEAREPGYFWGQCAEFCGDSHAVMRFRVIALSPRDFEDWLSNQLKPAREVPVVAAAEQPKAQFASLPLREYRTNEPGVSGLYDGISPLDAWKAKQFPETPEDPALIAQGRALFAAKTCITCHTVRGVPGAMGLQGPDLTHVGARSSIAGGLLDNTAEDLRRWIHNPGAVKPGNKMWVNGYVVNHITLAPDEEVALVAFLQSLK